MSQNELTVDMIDNQPYPKLKLKNDIFALLREMFSTKLLQNLNRTECLCILNLMVNFST